ncbi:putative transferase CAF17, mitochondrial [Porphyridium purpureum]|uniref:Putative transferase CAF17, mitochondrial n=1 Tax=Porphyridium purpureum TaxID=35688 RepID=A0A5J4YVQ7_PORPP|nr:putative transferase CAF17, mitochondrial [Porphyridium purpureum]|eukprot:POR2517..scf209_3
MAASCGRVCLHLVSSFVAPLRSRGVIRVVGPDTPDFLQGLFTNDVYASPGIHAEKLRVGLDSDQRELLQQQRQHAPPRLVFGAFLNHRGRVMAEAFLHFIGPDEALLDVDATSVPSLVKYLHMHRLRKQLSISDETGRMQVWTHTQAKPIDLGKTMEAGRSDQGTRWFEDSREGALGLRAVLQKNAPRPSITTLADNESEGTQLLTESVHRGVRILHGVPEGMSASLEFADTPLPLEMNLDVFNGVSFTKGCYVGQELTARTHHTGIVRKRLLPFVASVSQEAARARAERVLELEPGSIPGVFPAEFIEYDLLGQLKLKTELAYHDKEIPCSSALSSFYNIGLGVFRLDQAFASPSDNVSKPLLGRADNGDLFHAFVWIPKRIRKVLDMSN